MESLSCAPKDLLNLALARMTFLSAPERLLLLEKLDSIEALAVLSKNDLEKLVGRAIRSKQWDETVCVRRAERDALLMEQYGIVLVTVQDPRFPPLLRQVPQVPFALFVRGNVAALAGGPSGAFAMVGTRHPDGRGVEAAFAVAKSLVERGVTVVSGLAMGIDAASHRGALAAAPDGAAPVPDASFDAVPGDPYSAVAGGAWAPTVAVCGTGLDTIFPSVNKRLAVSILNKGGCLVSEYPPEFPGSRWSFPERNRIISGLCFGTMVVEAPPASGALITADFALEQGRELFVHPEALRFAPEPDSARHEAPVAASAPAVTGATARTAKAPPAQSTVHQFVRDGATVTDNVDEITAASFTLPKETGEQILFDF